MHVESSESAEQSAEQRSDDGLAPEQKPDVVPVRQRLGRVLEPEQQAAAQGRSGDRGGDDRPARVIVDHVTPPAALIQVQPESDDVRERLEHEVGVETDRTDCPIGREGHHAPATRLGV